MEFGAKFVKTASSFSYAKRKSTTFLLKRTLLLEDLKFGRLTKSGINRHKNDILISDRTHKKLKNLKEIIHIIHIII